MIGNGKRAKVPGWLKAVGFVVLLPAAFGGFYLLTTQPSFTRYPASEERIDPARLHGHVKVLSEKFVPRDYKRIWNLNKCADYISDHFSQAGAVVSEQTYEVKGNTYRNVIANFGPTDGSRIVVGAHYDAYQDTPGADDNASGVAGLLELAYMLGRADLPQQVELVAFTLEEPPFFRSGNMGSARHAYSLRLKKAEVEVMICLEMIGYFNDAKGSQRFPSAIVKLFYPDAGNFIAVMGSTGDRKWTKQIKNSMRSATDLPVHSMSASQSMPGLDFSDHRNYWNHGYQAVMITDTAFMRNLAYHGSADTADRLDYDRMSKVVVGVYEAVVRIANERD
jgi:hypothetical protein